MTLSTGTDFLRFEHMCIPNIFNYTLIAIFFFKSDNVKVFSDNG